MEVFEETRRYDLEMEGPQSQQKEITTRGNELDKTGNPPIMFASLT
jgi:hypothetical protein